MNDLMQQYIAQILALQKEVERLNVEMEKFKDLAFKYTKSTIYDLYCYHPLQE